MQVNHEYQRTKSTGDGGDGDGVLLVVCWNASKCTTVSETEDLNSILWGCTHYTGMKRREGP